MARKVMVRNVFIDGGVQTLGLPELVDEADFVQEASGFTQAANVDLAAGANPTKAEFDALVNSLIAAGLMASA